MRPKFSALLEVIPPGRQNSVNPSVTMRRLVTNSDGGFSYRRLADEYTTASQASPHTETDKDRDRLEVDLPDEQELRKASLQQLSQFRRRYALKNHPDRVPAHNRNAATREMAQLNRMIDDELTRRR